MDKILKYGLFMLVIFSLSCQDEDNDSNPLDVITARFEAKIDGEDFVANTKFYNDDTGYIVITGQRIENGNIKDQIVLTIPSLETGSYTIGLDNTVAMNYSITDSAGSYIGYSGTVTITEIENNKMSGLFTFQASTLTMQTVSISDGQFEDIAKTSNQ